MAKSRPGKQPTTAGFGGDAASEPPQICSFACPYGDFPPPESAGACRTMSAVYCAKLARLVDKNLPCHWRATGG